MPPLNTWPPDNRNPAGGETSGANYKNSSNVIFPKIFQRVNSRPQRLQDALVFNEAFAAAVERDLFVRCMRKYLGDEERVY